MTGPNIIVVEDELCVARALCTTLEKKCNEKAALGLKFYVGLSGGSVIGLLSKGLKEIDCDWGIWRIFFCDERLVTYTSPDSTYGQYCEMLVDSPLKKENFFPVNPNLSVDDAAADYSKKIRDEMLCGIPAFDVLVLGLGPDGHTCSLFPGHKVLEETSLIVAPVNDSPKPPPCRVTFTYPVLNSAKCCIFAAAGDSKSQIIKEILVEKAVYPASLVKPSGELLWILDKKAASLL